MVPRAEKAIPVAARLARASGGSILLAQATTIPIMYEAYGGSSYMEEVIDAEMKSAEDYLETIAQAEALTGIKVETTALFGAAAQTLFSMATMFKADLVVMTSQGKTGLKRWMLDSVAQKVARHSPIPVLVLHETGTMPVGARPDGGPVRALVTMDGSVLAKTALEAAAQLIAALSAPAPGALHLREGPVGKLKLAFTWSVALSDDVVDAIIRVAESGEDAAGAPGRCNVVAMASHGRAGLQHWVLCSVTERILRVESHTHMLAPVRELARYRVSTLKAR